MLTSITTAVRFLGTPAWKTRNTRHLVLKQERNEMSSEEKIGMPAEERKETANA